MERQGHDARLSTLRKVASALGLPANGLGVVIERFLVQHPDSIHCASLRTLADGAESWRIHPFDFVDAFRAAPEASLIDSAPIAATEKRIRCLAASTVEALCEEAGLDIPSWCAGIGPLQEPWFVAGVENLKAMALAESPATFRKRNIFVLGNFLDRA